MPLKYQKKNILILVILLCVAVVFSVWLYLDNTRIDITKLTIENEHIPKSFDGFTIVQVSDLHNAEFGEANEKLIETLKKAEPDLIAITGDLIDANHTDVDVALSFIEQAVAIAPVYFVTGNHEYANHTAFEQMKYPMEVSGVRILINERVTIEQNGETIQFIGIDDAYGTDLDSIEKAVEDKIVTDMASLKSSDTYCIVLSHRPEYFDAYCQSGADLVLTGHAHGGQIRLPFIGGVVAPGQGLFPEYTEGAYEKENTTMIVSRGLGNSILPVRVNNPPEVVVIRLKVSH